MPSLVNTLRRWYSTVRGLRNSSAPISGFVCPSTARRAISAARLDREPAHGLAGGRELAPGTLGEPVRADAAERLVGCTKLLACVHTTLLTTQPLAVEEPGAGYVHDAAAALEPLDRLAVKRLGTCSAAQQRA
jgi:hypothetical protein